MKEDVVVVKISQKTGGVLWEHPWRTGLSLHPRCKELLVDNSGNPVVLVHSSVEGNIHEYALFKLSGDNGQVVWSHSSLREVLGWEGVWSGAAAADGIYVAGTVRKNVGIALGLARLSASNGNIEWSTEVSVSDVSISVYSEIMIVGPNHDHIGLVGSFSQGIAGDPFITIVAALDTAEGTLRWDSKVVAHPAQPFVVRAVALSPRGDVAVASGPFYRGVMPHSAEIVALGGATGEVLWQGEAVANRVASALSYDSQGDLLFLGDDLENRRGVGTGYQTLLQKLRGSDGRLIWESHLDARSDPINSFVVSEAVLLSRDGDVLISGWASGFPEDKRFVARCNGASGDWIWDVRLKFDDNQSLLFESDTGFIVAVGSPSGSFELRGLEYRSGEQRWLLEYDGLLERAVQAEAATVDVDGSVFQAGRAGALSPVVGASSVLVKYYKSGDVVWVREFPEPADLPPGSLGTACDLAGNLYLVGSRADGHFLRKVSGASGDLLWEVNGEGGSGLRVVVGAAGNPLVLADLPGGSAGFGVSEHRASDGGVVWRSTSGPEASEGLQGKRLVVDQEGGVLVMSGYQPELVPAGIQVERFRQSDGQRLWRTRLGAFQSGRTSYQGTVGADLSVGPLGTVAVSGVSRTEGQSDLYVAVLDLGTGAVRWDVVYDGLAHGSDVARGLSVDPSGDVALSADVRGRVEDPDASVLKFDGKSGVLKWIRGFPGVLGTRDVAGPVLATPWGTFLLGARVDSNLALAEFASGDGAVLWSDRVSGWGPGVPLALNLLSPTEVALSGSFNELSFNMVAVAYRKAEVLRVTIVRSTPGVLIRCEGLGTRRGKVERSADMKAWVATGEVTEESPFIDTGAAEQSFFYRVRLDPSP